MSKTTANRGDSAARFVAGCGVAIALAFVSLGHGYGQEGAGASPRSPEAGQNGGSAGTSSALLRNEPGAFAGYTLIAPMRTTTTYLIDMQGRVVRSWDSEYSPGHSAYLLENGNLLRAGSIPRPA